MSLMQSPPTHIMTPSINTTKRSIVAASKPPIGSTIISNPSATTSMMKAIRCQFFVNGDRHFAGIPFVINQDRLRTLDSLCSELSRILINVKTLPSGVRIIFNGHDGMKIDSIKQFRQNKYYVCSSSEHFIRLDYLFIRHNHNNNNNNNNNHNHHHHHHNSHNLMPNFSDDVLTINEEKVSDDNDHHHHSLSLQNSTINTTKKPRHCLKPNEPKQKTTCHKKRMMIGEEKNNNHNLNSLHPTNSMTSSSSSNQTFMSNVANVSDSLNNCLLSVGGVCILKPKLIALLRGSCRAEPQLRPSRRVFRFLLNHRIAQNYEQFLNEISKCVKLNVGAVHKVFALYSSKKIACLNDLNDEECVYLVYGRSEKCSINDFLLDEYEQREICSIVGHSYLDSYFDGKPLNNSNNNNGSRILNRNLLKNNQNHNGNSNRKIVRYCDEIDIYNDDNNNNNHKDNQGRKFKFYLRNSHQNSRKNGHFGGTLMAKSNGHINENRFVTETYDGHEDNDDDDDEGGADEDEYEYDEESNLRAYSLPRNFNCKEDEFYGTEAGGTKLAILNDIYHNDDGKHKNESKENDTNRDGDVAAFILNDDDDEYEYEYGDGDHYFHSTGQTCSLRDDPGRPNKFSLQRRRNQNNHHHHHRKSHNLNVHSCSASSLSSDNPNTSTTSLLLSDSRKTIKHGSTPKILAPSDNHDQIRQQRSNNLRISQDQNWQNSSSNSSLVLMDNVADSNIGIGNRSTGALTNTPLTFSTIRSEDQSPPVSRSNFVVQGGCGSSTPGGASSISCSDDFSFTTFANRNVENNNNDDNVVNGNNNNNDDVNIELLSSNDSSIGSVSFNPMNLVSKPKTEQSVCRKALPSEDLLIRNPKPLVESLDEDLSQKIVMRLQDEKPSFIDSKGMKAVNKLEPTSTNCNIDKKNGEKKSLKPIKNCWTIHHNRNLRNTVSSANNCSKSSKSVTNRKRFSISANKSTANQMEPSLIQLKPPNQILELKKRPTSASPPPPPPLPPPTSSPIPQRSSPMVRADQPRPVLNQIPAATRFVPKKEVNDVYFVDKSIGDGKFGVVYTCIHRETRQSYALKVVNKFTMRQVLSEQPQNQRSNNNNSNNQCDEANSEVSILKLVKHPNIVRLYEHFDYVDQCYLVLELLQGGDLFDAISVATKYSEPESASMITDLLNALDYLHRLNIVHRDIKLENLLVSFVPISDSNIDTGNGPKMASIHPAPKQYKRMIKLADFGLAVQIKSDEKLYTVCGTPTYVAPEILLEIGYSFPVDIWAAGVILYILLSGLPPFVNEENDQLRLFDQIISGRFEFYGQQWRQISSNAKQIIQSMLCIDQHKRITALQLLEHDWIVHFK